MNKIYWFTGQSGAGKTTLANEVAKDINAIILDGDEMRDSISLGAGFSRKDRQEHNYRVARLAKELVKQQNVIVAVIAPMTEVREEINKICNPEWVYVKRDMPSREGHFYEEGNYFTIDHNVNNIQQSKELFLEHIGNTKERYSLFIGRWQIPNGLHEGHLKLISNSQYTPLIGIRDTAIDENNPYSAKYRQEQINKLGYKTIILPDIAEVCYGRGVGYEVNEIKLDKETEKISATNIRRGK